MIEKSKKYKEIEIKNNSIDESKITYKLNEYGAVLIRNILEKQDQEFLKQSFKELHQRNIPMSREILYTHKKPKKSPGMKNLMDQWLNPHLSCGEMFALQIEVIKAKILSWFGYQNIFLFQTLLTSRTNKHHPFPWHQDFPFWPVDKPEGLIIWLSLDFADGESGGIEFALKSHQIGIGPSINLYNGCPQSGFETQKLPEFREESIIAPQFCPGDALILHPLLWHRSSLNHTSSLRRVWISSWLPETVNWSKKNAPLHPLCKTVQDGSCVISEKD